MTTFALLCALLMGMVQPVVTPAPPGELAHVVLLGDDDAGPVQIGQSVDRRATLRNPLDCPVRVRVVRSTCSCVSTDLSADVIPPHGESSCEIHVAVTGGVGQQRHGVELEFTTVESPPRVAKATVTVAYTPDRAFDVRPSSVRATWIAGEPSAIELFVTRRTPGALSVSRAECDVFSPASLVAVLGKPQSVTRSLVWAHTPSAAGLAAGFITFDTDSARTPSLAVPIAVRVLPAWTASPAGVVVNTRAPLSVVLRARRPDDKRVPASVHLDGRAIEAEIRPLAMDASGCPQFAISLPPPPSLPIPLGRHGWVRIRAGDGSELSRVLIAFPVPLAPE